MNNPSKNKKIISKAIIIGLILYLIPNLIYWIKFCSFKISDDPAQWGQYGDFIGGSLNPLLTMLNIIALIYLTYTVAELEQNRVNEIQKVEDQRANSQIETQKLILLNQMRYEVLTEFSQAMQLDVNTKVDFVQYLRDKMVILDTFTNDKRFLFPQLMNSSFEDNYISPLKNTIYQLHNQLSHPNEGKIRIDVVKYHEQYRLQKSTLVDLLYQFLIKELSTKTQ